jgi:hypothetical protein
MKHTLLLSFLSIALLTHQRSEAQIPGVSKIQKALPKVDLGIKLGANFQQLDGNTAWKDTYNAGIFGGAFVGVHKGKMGVQAEVLLKSVKYDLNVGSTSPITYIKALYLDIPVLFQYRLIPRLWVQAGPQFSIMLNAKDNLEKDVKSNFSSSDISGVLGLEAKLPIHLVAGARYVYGFTDINDNATATDAWRNRSIQLYLGYRFL